jgi:hypothetical protein
MTFDESAAVSSHALELTSSLAGMIVSRSRMESGARKED